MKIIQVFKFSVTVQRSLLKVVISGREGETKRNLCKKADEHMRAVRMADFNSLALAEHAWNAGHRVDWSEVTI